MIATLRQRNFALMWLAGLISLAGDWALSVGLPIDVYTLTHSVLATAIMLMCAVTPGVLVGSVAGVFVDRWDHKRTMVAINATSPPPSPPSAPSPTTSTPARYHSPDLRITERATDQMVLATGPDHRSPPRQPLPDPAHPTTRRIDGRSGRFCGGCSSAWSCQYCSRQEWPSRHCRPKTAPAPAMGPCTARFQGSYQTIGVTSGPD
jgi:hypothetical protein